MARSLQAVLFLMGLLHGSVSLLTAQEPGQVITRPVVEVGPSGPGPQLAPPPRPLPAPPSPMSTLGLCELEQLALAQNPTLRQAEASIDVARSERTQAGLYPNPAINISADQFGSPRGQGGQITGPSLVQTILAPGKLGLDKAVASRGVDRADLALIKQRFAVLTAVRQDYFEVLTMRRRVEVLRELVRVATQSYEVAKKQVEAKQAARLDMIQLRINLNRILGDLCEAEQDQITAWRKLAADIGNPQMPESPLRGSIEAALPRYDYESALLRVFEVHPEVQSARVAVAQAELALKRARLEAIPNVTVGFGYTRDNRDHEDVWNFQMNLPVPVFNRNQGKIQAAQAEISKAIQEVNRVQNDLAKRLAEAFDRYRPATQRAELYRTQILPDAREAYKIALAAFKGGEFEYLKVLEAQKALEEANHEYIKILGDAWNATCEIAGLLLEEQWTCAPR